MDRSESWGKYYLVLTRGQYLTLRRLTSGDPKYQTERLKNLCTELNRAQLQAKRSRYHVRFTLQDLESAAFVLNVDSLRNGRRHINRLVRDYWDLMGSDYD